MMCVSRVALEGRVTRQTRAPRVRAPWENVGRKDRAAAATARAHLHRMSTARFYLTRDIYIF